MKIVQLNIQGGKGQINKFGNNTISNSIDLTESLNSKVKNDIDKTIKNNPLFNGKGKQSLQHLANFELEFNYKFDFESMLLNEINKKAAKDKIMIICESENEIDICKQNNLSYIYYIPEPIVKEKAKK